jgi:hypothetical protein
VVVLGVKGRVPNTAVISGTTLGGASPAAIVKTTGMSKSLASFARAEIPFLSRPCSIVVARSIIPAWWSANKTMVFEGSIAA